MVDAIGDGSSGHAGVDLTLSCRLGIPAPVLALAHNGVISARDVPGIGCAFLVDLPRWQAPAPSRIDAAGYLVGAPGEGSLYDAQ